MKLHALSPITFAGLFAVAASPTVAQTMTRISVGRGSTQSDADSTTPALSADCRYVAFFSEASNLVPGDTNGADDIFIRDRRTQTTVRVSVDSNGAESDGDSYDPSLSSSGRLVAFYSEATNLVPGDTNGFDDAFVHDIATGATVRISVDPAGAQGNERSVYPSLSGNGRFVVFHSWATNLVAGDTNGVQDVFVRDLVAGTTTRASVSATGAQGNGASEYGYLSADGTRLVFESNATNLVPGDTNGAKDMFVRDFATGTVQRVSVASNGAQGNGSCSYSSISDDGRFVGFESGSSNLVHNDLNGLTDVFVHDVDSGVTELVSVSTTGAQGNLLSYRSSLSRDGRFVVFKSQATTLVPGDTNGWQDIFVRDRRSGTTTRVNVSSTGAQANGYSSQPTISADGQHVAFYSFASNLVLGDTNGVADVFFR